MKKSLALLPWVLFTTLLAGCGSDQSPFTEGNGASIGTNIPADRNFQIAFDEPNPAIVDSSTGGIDLSQVVEVTITASDRLKLPTVGATAYLEADWGTLSATSCTIGSNGSCTITWYGNGSIDDPYFPTSGAAPHGGDGLVAFTAWILGEEAFDDLNDNGYFDDFDFFDTNDKDNTTNPGYDVAGPYLDRDHNLTYTPSIDQILLPGNNLNQRLAADNKYNGANCTHSTLCGSTTQIYISSRSFLYIIK